MPAPRTLLASLLFLAVPACTAAIEEPLGDSGETSSDLTSTSSCRLSRAQILANAVGARRTAIQRGFTWLDARVPYSQKASHGGYRTDCSGFVSMCWQLGTSFTTADFSSGGGGTRAIGAYSNLIPGDALVRRVGGEGHVVLFLGWNDANQSAACVLEQESTALDMQFHARSVSSLHASAFKAIRANKLAGTGAAPAGGDPQAPPTDPTGDDEPAASGADDPPPTNTGGGGQACVNTGMCNPGNDGSGLVCVNGRCVPGCITDAQCPGMSVCVSGQCR